MGSGDSAFGKLYPSEEITLLPKTSLIPEKLSIPRQSANDPSFFFFFSGGGGVVSEPYVNPLAGLIHAGRLPTDLNRLYCQKNKNNQTAPYARR